MINIQIILDKFREATQLNLDYSIGNSKDLLLSKQIQIKKRIPNIEEHILILLSIFLKLVDISIFTEEELLFISSLNLEPLNYLHITTSENQYTNFKNYKVKEKPAFDTGTNIVNMPYFRSQITSEFRLSALTNKCVTPEALLSYLTSN